MQFRIQDDVLSVSLRDRPTLDAPASAGTVIRSDLLEKIADAAEPTWWKVRVVTPGAPEREGFVRSVSLIEVEQTEAEEIDAKAFFRQIAFAAGLFGANRDYLFAVAVVASGLKNTRGGASSAVGPFRFMPETWKELVEQNGAETDITAADITDPGSQAMFAAILSLDARDPLNKSLGHMPTDAQLCCAHLLGIGAAATILGGDQQTPIIGALRDFYRGTSQGAGFADKIAETYSALLTGKTVGQVVDDSAGRLAAGLKQAAALAAELSLELPVPSAPASNNDLQAALRRAVRLNEIGDASPYKLSFAGKGNSGASFGFMQGDLAAGQPIARTAFRQALAAAGISATKISSLMRSLSAPLIENPLDASDTKLVNDALDASAGRTQVNTMDEQIFEDVCAELDKCIATAGASGKTIDPKAQIYMLLWINMTGPPTFLLDWLSGKIVTMAKPVPAAQTTVDGSAMEDFLRATSFFSENPGNLPHIIQSAAAGASLLESTGSTGAVRLSANPGINLEETESIKQLAAIVGEASKALPDGFHVTVTSALRKGATVAGTGGRSQHADGNAIDIKIINLNGQEIPNRGTDSTHLYQLLAIAAFHANERMFPARSGHLAWGGNFTTGPVDGPRDLMHFDYGGDRGRFGSLAQEASTTTTV
jgi:hypothetical protein